VLCDPLRRDWGGEVPSLLHACGVYPGNLRAPGRVRKPNFHLHLKAARAEERGVEHVTAIGHPNDEHIVDGVHAVDVGQELVDYGVSHACALEEGGSS